MKSTDAIDLLGYRPGSVGNFAVQLFSIAAQKPLPQTLPALPIEASPLMDVLYRYNVPSFQPRSVVAEGDAVDPGKAFVAFSGGKDCTASALKLVAQGKAVSLFHVSGINPAYSGEKQTAIKIAAVLGLPIHVLRVRLSKQNYIENPVKNATIAGLMIDYGIRHGAGYYAMGTMTSDHADEINFDAGFSDSIELMDAAKTTYESLVPGIVLDTHLLSNERDNYKTILQSSPDVIPLLCGCMAQARYKASLVKKNKQKFGDEMILPNRCGSCYKCAQEALLLMEMGALPFSVQFKNHAKRILVDNAPKVFGAVAAKWSADKIVKTFLGSPELTADAS